MVTKFLSGNETVAVLDADAELLRVSAEFHEMPDLVVTVAQAARLFGVDHAQSRRILDTLVSRGILSTDGRQFGRAGIGRRGI
jgi:DNA-binding IclR family transcriptional regulator